jgi:hypothetical protein
MSRPEPRTSSRLCTRTYRLPNNEQGRIQQEAEAVTYLRCSLKDCELLFQMLIKLQDGGHVSTPATHHKTRVRLQPANLSLNCFRKRQAYGISPINGRKEHSRIEQDCATSPLLFTCERAWEHMACFISACHCLRRYQHIKVARLEEEIEKPQQPETNRVENSLIHTLPVRNLQTFGRSFKVPCFCRWLSPGIQRAAHPLLTQLQRQAERGAPHR